VCEPTYDISSFKEVEINVYDLHFQDGANPPSYILEQVFFCIVWNNSDELVVRYIRINET
jgi:hypothetical protein